MYETTQPLILTWQYSQLLMGAVVGVIVAYAQVVVRIPFKKRNQ